MPFYKTFVSPRGVCSSGVAATARHRSCAIILNRVLPKRVGFQETRSFNSILQKFSNPQPLPRGTLQYRCTLDLELWKLGYCRSVAATGKQRSWIFQARDYPLIIKGYKLSRKINKLYWKGECVLTLAAIDITFQNYLTFPS